MTKWINETSSQNQFYDKQKVDQWQNVIWLTFLKEIEINELQNDVEKFYQNNLRIEDEFGDKW